MKSTTLIIIIILTLTAIGYFIFQIKQDEPQHDFTQIYTTGRNFNINTTPQTKPQTVIEPIAEFKKRITKKPFGIFITPDISPVQPEKFRGYHTAVDIEYEYTLGDIPVIAIADGEVVASKSISGYGGVIVIKHILDNKETILTIYGHLDNTRSVKRGKKIIKGEIIGYLGKNKSAETDYERKHLHFGIIKGNEIDYRGYVANENELKKWYDPLIFYK